ncbi:ATP-binding protein [Streptomyces tsukubensis]|uniref:ATP-binding protein n=1 Tax=Streptomyces tsukubensis TaxID=83656 RepID=UPI00098F98E9|nr:ATP-binding protein [Streptomyces tsukubensis]QFR94131.1 ATP-binding protein [Streptomyces tsukubensis]
MQVLQVQLEVRPDPAEVGRARRWVRSRLTGSGIGADEPLAETLLLIVSELVTNAVVHTGRPAVLRIQVNGTPTHPPGMVRVEVVDSSARPPLQRHARGEETNGRGLELVDGLADRWGWLPDGAGKRIWCEVDRCESAVSGGYEGYACETPADCEGRVGAGGGRGYESGALGLGVPGGRGYVVS